MKNLEIERILSRVECVAGVLEPYVCQCSDGNRYYVKGHYAGYRERIYELVAAQLGQKLGLRIPDFALATIPGNINPNDLFPGADPDLGFEPAFASQEVPDSMVLQPSANSTPEKERCLILLFDWWICNDDRTCDRPNLLFASGKTYVIDHNNAFGEPRGRKDFLSLHVFGNSFGKQKSFSRSVFETKLDAVMDDWIDIASTVPDVWLDGCSEGDKVLDDIRNKLERYRRHPQEFWFER